MKKHLFLQGPHGPFFKLLGKSLLAQGDKVIRINFCGGDMVDWPLGNTRFFRKKDTDWAAWIGRLMDDERITDLHIYGDWRPLHRESVLLARLRGIRIWAYEEGYLRPDYITMEADGVNGLSLLPVERTGILELAKGCGEPPEPQKLDNPQTAKTWRAIAYYTGIIFLWPVFHNFKKHRPQSAVREVWGWFLRVLSRSSRRKRNTLALRNIYHLKKPFFLFPLQLDSDSQVRRYSPYSGMKEAIAYIITSFAQSAPEDVQLIIRNHPLDNGLIDYWKFIDSYASACGIRNRVHFIEGGKAHKMLHKSRGLVVLNSTIGIQALRINKPVYCLGTSIYAFSGMAINHLEMSLDDFWKNPREPEQKIVKAFERVLQTHALINGNFYTERGMSIAIDQILKRLASIDKNEAICNSHSSQPDVP